MFPSIIKFLKSFVYAWEGIKTGFQQRNFRVHTLALLIVLWLGLYFQVSPTEWILIILVSAAVMSAELFNSALEEVCNLLNAKLKLDYFDTWHPRNLAAAAVLIIAIAALFTGLVIFVPKFYLLFS